MEHILLPPDSPHSQHGKPEVLTVSAAQGDQQSQASLRRQAWLSAVPAGTWTGAGPRVASRLHQSSYAAALQETPGQGCEMLDCLPPGAKPLLDHPRGHSKESQHAFVGLGCELASSHLHSPQE